MVTTRGSTAKRIASATVPAASLARSAKKPRVSESMTTRRGGQEFSDLASKTINQLTKLRNEAYTTNLRVLGNNLNREIQRRQGATKRKMSPSPVATAASKKARTITNLKASMRKRGSTARTPWNKELARQELANEQFRNQITKILNTQKLSKDKLKTLKNNANERNGMKNISNRINLLLNPVRATPKTPGRPMSARGKTAKTPGRPMSARAPIKQNKILKNTNDILVYVTQRTRELEFISNKNRNFTNFVNKQKNKSNLPRLKRGYIVRNLAAWAIVFKLFKKDIPTTQIPKGGVGQETIDEIHSEIMKANKYRFGVVSSEVNSTPMVLPIDKESADAFIYLMWLDGIHDEYSPNTFDEFKSSLFYKTFFPGHIWSNNNFIEDINKTIGTLTKGTFEKKLKENIQNLFEITEYSTVSGPERFNVTNESKKIFVSIDQELRDNKPISKFVKGSNGLEPYITVGSLIDPGRMMPLEGVSSEVTNIIYFLNNPNTVFRLKNRYDVGPLKLILKIGDTIFMDIDVSINKGIAQTKLTKVEKSSDYFSIKFNGVDIKLGSTKNAAKLDAKSAMGKFLGDALQYIIVNLRNTQSRKNTRAFGTGDGMAAVLSAFFATKVFDINPVMILDSAKVSNQLTLFGFGSFGKKVKINLVGNRMTEQTGLTRNSPVRNESPTVQYLRRTLGSKNFNRYNKENQNRIIQWTKRKQTNNLALPNKPSLESWMQRIGIIPENVTSKPMAPR